MQRDAKNLFRERKVDAVAMKSYKWKGYLALQTDDERVSWYSFNSFQGWHLFSAWDSITVRGVRWNSAGYFNNQIPVLRFMLITGVEP